MALLRFSHLIVKVKKPHTIKKMLLYFFPQATWMK